MLNGVKWNLIERILLQGVGFFIGIILARLLSPSDYGLIGMLAIFTAISQTLIDSGFTRSLIQKKNCESIDYSTAFVTNVGMSLVLYGILFFCAPLIASFYNEPILIPLTRVVSLNFVLGSFNIVQRARLQSKVDFKSLAKVNVTASTLSGITGVIMAYMGFGVWALVFQTLCSSIVTMLLLPFFSKWHPSVRFSTTSFKALWKFGSKLLATGTMAIIMNNISTICIGKVYMSNQLGFFTRAQSFPQMVSDTVYQVLGNVTFPVLSKLQDDREHLVSVYRQSLYHTALLIFPVMVLLTVLAKPLVIVLLTEKWLGSVVMMQWLFMARMFTPLSALNMNILNAIGRSDLFMKVDFSKIPLMLIMLAITTPIGVKAIAIGMFVHTFICFFINSYLPGRLFGYGAWQQIKDWKWIILSTIIMAIVVGLYCVFFENNYVLLIGGGVVGVSVYVACCLAFKMIDKETLDSVLVALKIKKTKTIRTK